MIILTPDTRTNRSEYSGSLVAGATSDWVELTRRPDRNALCSYHPGSGGTIRMEYTLDPLEVVRTGTPKKVICEKGDVSTDDGCAIPTNVTAVRFVATGTDGEYRVVV